MTATRINTACITAHDGLHEHRYEIRTLNDLWVVSLHLHSWMDGHRANHPRAGDVTRYRHWPQETYHHDSLELAWTALRLVEPIPALTCTHDQRDAS